MPGNPMALPCLTTTHLFTWFESYYQIMMKTLVSSLASPYHSTIPGWIRDSRILFDVLHIDPHLYVFVAICLIQCSSAVYYIVAMISLSHGVMNP